MRLKATVLAATSSLIVGVLPLPASAQVETKCESRYRVYFGNGIRNVAEDWEASRLVLSKMIGARFNGVPVSYSNAINPTGGFIDDLQRVFQQKLSENPDLSWELLVRASLGLINGISPELAKFVLDLIIKTETESSAELKKKWEAVYSYIDGRVTTHVADYTRDILENGRRVLLVAHSQGNLYANASHRLLYTNPEITPGSFATIGVATPANYVAGGGTYLTSDADVVINALRSIITDQVLPANVSIPLDTGELSGHNFIKTYMHPEKPAREKIQQMTTVALNRLMEPKGAYDYKIVSYIAESTGSNGSSYLATGYCPDFGPGYELWQAALCPRYPNQKSIYDSKGVGYDPTLPSEVDTFTRLIEEANHRLRPITNQVDRPESPIYWLSHADLPSLFTWTSNWPGYGCTTTYDINGNLTIPVIRPLGPNKRRMCDAIPGFSSWPNISTVYLTKVKFPLINLFQNTISNDLKFEYSNLPGNDLAWPGTTAKQNWAKFSLKICKPYVSS